MAKLSVRHAGGYVPSKREIARRAGLTHPTVLNYFKGRASATSAAKIEKVIRDEQRRARQDQEFREIGAATIRYEIEGVQS
jgi:AcrR family transcriptional regulator